jgi:hypothetical protein
MFEVAVVQGFNLNGGPQRSIRHGGRSRRGVEDWQL